MLTIVLVKNMTIKEGLTYEQASEVMSKAYQTPAAQYLDFSISRKTNEQTWNLDCRVKSLIQMFLENPEAYAIEVHS